MAYCAHYLECAMLLFRSRYHNYRDITDITAEGLYQEIPATNIGKGS
jgi:hypothetical protein